MIRALHQALGQLVAAGSKAPFCTPPAASFRSEAEQCVHCGGDLRVQKTVRRQVVTFHVGAFTAHETVMVCPKCKRHVRSAELSELVPVGCNFGYDVMNVCGRSLLLEHRTADETVAALAARNVVLSASEVRELAARFVAYLGVAHLQAAPALSRLFAMNGGYILHLDSTSRKGSRKLLSGIDEITGLVLLNVKLGSETADDVAAFLRDIVARYGLPLAVGCDMAASIRKALRTVLSGVPVYICHFHFLRDAGNDMMKADYQRLGALLDGHKTVSKLRDLKKVFLPHLTEHVEAVEQFLSAIDEADAAPEAITYIPYEALLAGLLFSAVEAERQGDGFGFPFDRTKLQFYDHLLHTYRSVQSIRDAAATPAQRKLADKLLKPLSAVANDAQLTRLAEALERNAAVFDRMRGILRVAEPSTPGGLSNPDPVDVEITQAKSEFTAFKEQLQSDNAAAPQLEITKLIEQIERHWDGLFRDPLRVTTADGVERIIHPQRTNNIMEHFFRDLGRNERRRTGLTLSTRRLNAMLPDTPLVCNLQNPAYMELLLDGCDTLEERFSRIDPAAVRDSLAEAKSNGQVFSKPRNACRILRRVTTPLHFALCAVRQALSRLNGGII